MVQTVGRKFETQVRSVARALWNLRDGEGASELINNDEIDCVCRTEDLIHLIECTTDGRMEKFRTQVTKLVSAKGHLERRGETVKLWSVTQEEPTPHQRSHARGSGVTALSYQEFKRRLLNSAQYLDARLKYRFGSAADPDDGSHRLREDEYVQLPLVPIGSRESYSVRDICDLLTDGKTVVLVGPFGAGKSLTVREVFHCLRGDFHRGRIEQTPVAINLREHWGQFQVDEVLRRHSDRIGFDFPNQLVRAWNAGQILPLLDGFDELTSPVLAMTKNAISNSRRQAIGVVRTFLRDVGNSGILIAGRDHYFDSNQEAMHLMNLPSDSIFIEVGEFSEEQAVSYLKKKNIIHSLPSWLPRKPLLLGYLASSGLLDEVVNIDGDEGTALAWDRFLNRICEREAELSPNVIDSISFRQLLEDLATRVRTRAGGTGPLLESDLADAYKKVTGYEALEPARILLQRLPGLTARDQEVGQRSFIDGEMLEALQGGAVARFIQNPYDELGLNALQHPLSEFGCSVASHLTDQWGMRPRQYSVASDEAKNRWANSTLALDSILTGANNSVDDAFDANHSVISGALADVIDMEERPIKHLALSDCMINHVRYESRQSQIEFRGCDIVRLEGIGGYNAMPQSMSNCEIGEFDNRQTNAAIIRSSLPDSIKVLLVITRKLFLQRGSGRAESALYRGINESLQPYIDQVRDILLSEGVIYSHSTGQHTIWHGNRSKRARMLKILEDPTSSDDSLIRAVSELGKQ